jgi:hypothetical protein
LTEKNINTKYGIGRTNADSGRDIVGASELEGLRTRGDGGKTVTTSPFSRRSCPQPSYALLCDFLMPPRYISLWQSSPRRLYYTCQKPTRQPCISSRCRFGVECVMHMQYQILGGDVISWQRMATLALEVVDLSCGTLQRHPLPLILESSIAL